MGTVRTMRVVAVLLLLLGAAVTAPSTLRAASDPPQDVVHEVLAGDCLHLIAGYYYGDTRLWERIWKANRDVIRNPNVLVLGTFLRVPDTAVPAEPYPDFAARAIGCGPAGAAHASAGGAEKPPEATPATASPPSKAR